MSAITAFEIRSTPSSALAYEAYLEIHNYGKRTKKTTITIAGRRSPARSIESESQAGGEFGEPFDLSKFEGGGIRATVQSGGDAFSLDDVAYAYLPVKPKTQDSAGYRRESLSGNASAARFACRCHGHQAGAVPA